MAAQIVYRFGARDSVREALGYQSGDTFARMIHMHPLIKTPGQLWERVAESGPRLEPHDLWKEAIERGPRFARNPRSPLASGVIGPRFTLSDRSGIIRAGERIK